MGAGIDIESINSNLETYYNKAIAAE